MFSSVAEPRGACNAQSYRTGAWRHTPNASAPYRLEREFDRNPFVKGWKYAYRSFWGLCDLGLPRNVSRRSTQYAWQPDGCNLRPFSAPRFCSQFVRPSVQRELVLAGDSFTGQLFISLLALLAQAGRSTSWRRSSAAGGSFMEHCGCAAQLLTRCSIVSQPRPGRPDQARLAVQCRQYVLKCARLCGE